MSRNVDRHGKTRWRVRKKGVPQTYLPGEYGSAEFRTAYECIINGDHQRPESVQRHQHGTFNWLIEQYHQTPTWQRLAPISKRNLSHDFERFRREHGQRSVAGLRPEHVEALLAKKSTTPSAANKLLKLIKRLSRFAIRRGLIHVDPTIGVGRYVENPDGFHTWTDDEIDRFEKHHGVYSKAVLALRLMLFTGAARQDICRMGWQNVKNNRIAYRRGKTGGEISLPILDELTVVIERVPKDRLLFVTHSGDRPKPSAIGSMTSVWPPV